MRTAGYRSTDSYLVAARERNAQHEPELGFVVDEQLKVWIRGAELALLRGVGPAHKAVVFDPLARAAEGALVWTQTAATRIRE